MYKNNLLKKYNSSWNSTIEAGTGTRNSETALDNSNWNSDHKAAAKTTLSKVAETEKTRNAIMDVPLKEESTESVPVEKNTVPLLFATATCPNCRIACSYMDKAGFAYKKLLANENVELSMSYGVKQAPTLVLPDGTKYAGAGAIKQFLSSLCKV